MHVLNKIGCINGKITRQIRKDVNLFYSSLFTHRVVKYKVFFFKDLEHTHNNKTP